MPQTIAEGLLYSTVKLTALHRGTPVCDGTGFFMNFEFEPGRSIPTIITNKHVLEGSDEVRLACHMARDGGPSGTFASCRASTLAPRVFNHPRQDVDLCAIIFGELLNNAAMSGTPLFVYPLVEELIPTDEDWKFFDAIEEVTMIGCPNGISDEVNNVPIVRRGITASSLARNYNGKGEFMVDIACFPGSSGSPVFLYNPSGYFDRRKNSYMLGSFRLMLVGILYAGPKFSNEGEVVLGQTSKFEVASMMHLGNVIKSSELKPIRHGLKVFFGDRTNSRFF